MKVLIINGSPRANGNTSIALKEMIKVFDAEGVETEVLQIGNKDIRSCIACGKCIQSGCPSVVLSDEKHPRTGKRKARIEPVTCVGCGICAQICPVHAISGPEQA